MIDDAAREGVSDDTHNWEVIESIMEERTHGEFGYIQLDIYRSKLTGVYGYTYDPGCSCCNDWEDSVEECDREWLIDMICGMKQGDRHMTREEAERCLDGH